VGLFMDLHGVRKIEHHSDYGRCLGSEFPR